MRSCVVRLRTVGELYGEVAEWCNVVQGGAIGYILLLYHKLKPIW